jgi:hypothetical protein
MSGKKTQGNIFVENLNSEYARLQINYPRLRKKSKILSYFLIFGIFFSKKLHGFLSKISTFCCPKFEQINIFQKFKWSLLRKV